ncbi:Putative protein [Zobellia galactanivorans]|uniref:Uncharacterized protein n=1 Tax=Zobellia galactanivorans (strain DSM 12802 / CCUG 47099 / CIP 106680 / NCIMB 13871 / Dsij) TaxID=63186 RepID=G0L1D1_ZOBGA|nr:Putative protein [Zobellia galactanivorans]
MITFWRKNSNLSTLILLIYHRQNAHLITLVYTSRRNTTAKIIVLFCKLHPPPHGMRNTTEKNYTTNQTY